MKTYQSETSRAQSTIRAGTAMILNAPVTVAAMAPALCLALLAPQIAPRTAEAQTAPPIAVPAVVMPEPDAPITAARTRALRLFKALTGVTIPIDDPRLKNMETLIAAGNEKGAAKIATLDPLFYDVKVRDLARKMSTREESVRAPLSDFVATLIGVVRDSDTTSAKELLTGNFIYTADPALTLVNGQQRVRSDVFADMINSNNHYADIQTNNFSLYAVLRRTDGQQIANGQNATATIPHPDTAGLLTTRGWHLAHADAGTNRRLVEYTFRQFMCSPLTDWADASQPDDRVGRDVDRMPSGSNEKYQVTCKACHAQMDGLRGAFAFVDFLNNKPIYQATVVGKMNRNANEFPQGYPTTDASFINYATEGKNKDAFGWRSALVGNGLKAFGTMIANSQGFSRCMVRKVFSEICNRDPALGEETNIRKIADEFEASNYNLRGLFETVAVRPECVPATQQ